MADLTVYAVYIIPITLAVIAYVILINPTLSKRVKFIHQNNVTSKRYLLDDRYGLCRIKQGQRLNEESFKLWLETPDQHEYQVKYFYGDIIPVNDFDITVNDTGTVMLQTARFKKLKTMPEQIDEVQHLKNELIKQRANAKIAINNPDENVNKMVDWLVKFEQSKNKGRTEVRT